VTTGCARSICGNLETSAARIARSAQSDEASDSLSSRQRLHGAVPGARRPWTSTSGRTTTAGSAAAQRPGTADATTQATIMPRRLTTPISLVSGASRLLESLRHPAGRASQARCARQPPTESPADAGVRRPAATGDEPVYRPTDRDRHHRNRPISCWASRQSIVSITEAFRTAGPRTFSPVSS